MRPNDAQLQATAPPRPAPGIRAPFSGPRGTGKTLAAAVLANDLALDLIRVDLGRVVSRYLGETEKNLAPIFDAADESGAMLTTDHRDASDPAFIRQLHRVVEFPFPAVAARRKLWRRHSRHRPAGVHSGQCSRKRGQHGAGTRRHGGAPTESPLQTDHSMPPEYLAPGVYVEEVTKVAHAINGVATTVTAFVGRTPTGPTTKPSSVTSIVEFERIYGALSSACPLTYAVHHFFDNGGREAIIARVVHRDARGRARRSAPITDADLAAPSLAAARRGLWLLDKATDINLLCIPPLGPGVDLAPSTWNTAIHYAKRRRAFVIVDPPSNWFTAAQAASGIDQFIARDTNAALYFPRILAPDPLAADSPRPFAPCGAIAGVYARTVTERGVWTAPAGAHGQLQGITALTCNLTDRDNDLLNPIAINALRTFPARGNIIWGARTLVGTDSLASEWKYVNVRRLSLFIEESIDRGTQWVVFEPNAEPLWSQIRLNVGAFMQSLFRQGAFQGATDREAYFVKCDATTTTQDDIDLGVVNVLVGFAPLKPAEFIVLKFAVRTATARA